MSKYMKMAVGTGSIVGLGYLLMKYTTPTDEQLINSLSPELRKKYEEQKAIREEQNRLLYEKVHKSALKKAPNDYMEEVVAAEKEIHKQVLERRRNEELDQERQRLKNLAQQEKGN